jgi:hypothetical protein
MRRLTALTLLCGALGAHAMETCRVLDPELQGQYEGGCDASGLANGAGTASSNIAIYRGEFLLGKKHGQGSKQWLKTGDRYKGEFDDDFRHGWGIYRWGSASQWAGQEYTGQFNRDKLEGIGTYLWPNGDKFSGTWKNNLRYGESYMEQRQRIQLELIQKHIQSSSRPMLCQARQQGLIARVLIRGEVKQAQPAPQVLFEINLDQLSGQSLGQTKLTETAQQIVQWSPCQ